MSFQRLREETSKKSKTLICGTSASAAVLADTSLRDALNREFNVWCVNTAHHFWRDMDVLFLKRDYRTHCSQPQHFVGKNIRFLISSDNRHNIQACFLQVAVDLGRTAVISDDITAPLPLGPTTILDMAIPAAMYCGAKDLYLIGADYPLKKQYTHFDGDAQYRHGPRIYDFHSEMLAAHQKWRLWFTYFAQHGVKLQSFSAECELDVPKLDPYSFLNIARVAA